MVWCPYRELEVFGRVYTSGFGALRTLFDESLIHFVKYNLTASIKTNVRVLVDQRFRASYLFGVFGCVVKAQYHVGNLNTGFGPEANIGEPKIQIVTCLKGGFPQRLLKGMLKFQTGW